MDIFVENGHNKQFLKNFLIKYNNKKNNKNNNENNTENRDYKNLNKLPWIPNISPKIKRESKKIGKDTTKKDTTKLLPNSQPVVH